MELEVTKLGNTALHYSGSLVQTNTESENIAGKVYNGLELKSVSTFTWKKTLQRFRGLCPLIEVLLTKPGLLHILYLSNHTCTHCTGNSGRIRTHDLMLSSAGVLTSRPPSLPDDDWPARILYVALSGFCDIGWWNSSVGWFHLSI